MEIVEQSRFETTRDVRSYDAAILLGYAVFAILLLIAMYLDSMSSGTATAAFASMTVFP